MKKLFFPVILLLFFSCQEELSPSENHSHSDNNTLPFEGESEVLTLSHDSDTKAAIAGTAILWENGDRIIVNGEEYPISVNQNEAVVTVRKAESYSAFFPAQIYNSGKPLIQPAQYYVKGSFGSASYPMAAESSSNSLRFESLCGVLELTVTGYETLSSINIKDKASGSLCGQYSMEGGKLVTCGDIHYDNVTLNCMKTGGTKLSPSGEKFYIVLPARTYSDGLVITISTVSGRSMTVDSPTSRTITAGEVLCTPTIEFKVDPTQIYSYHFDNLTYGSDPVAEKQGFAVSDPGAPGAYEICRTLTSTTEEAGTALISTNIKNNGSSYFALSKDYIASRNLDNFMMLGNVSECHGYLGAGINGNEAPNIKLPPFTNLDANTICQAEVTFKLAWQKNRSLSALSVTHTYSTTGKVLELWIDGVKLADYRPNGTAKGSMADNTRWTTNQSTDGIDPKYYNTEWVRILPEDMADYKWHDVKIVFGVVTSGTVVQISPKIASGGTSAFFIDDIEARRIDYKIPDKHLPWTSLCNPMSATTINYLKNHAKALNMGGDERYIDIIMPDYATLKNKWRLDDELILGKMDSVATIIRNAGFKVWDIHLPDTDEDGSYDSDTFEFFHYFSWVRNAAVDRMKQIIRWAKPFQSVNLLIHATGPGRDSYSFSTYKDKGVESFKALVDYANSEEMKYPDGTHPVLCIENIQNNGTTTSHVCAKPEYMNYYCSQVPGLKVGFDTGHAIVGSGMSAVEYVKALGANLGVLHIHGNGTTEKDYHLYPGYSNGVYKGSETYPCGDDLIDWNAFYNALVNYCNYTGPFSYELGVEAVDGIVSFNNVAHNYYSFILNQE